MEGPPTWEWVCEDDEEALGLETILRRHGLHPHRVERDRRIVLRADGADAELAEALHGKIAQHYVTRLDREARHDLQIRRQRGHRLLGAVVAGSAIALLLVQAC